MTISAALLSTLLALAAPAGTLARDAADPSLPVRTSERAAAETPDGLSEGGVTVQVVSPQGGVVASGTAVVAHGQDRSPSPLVLPVTTTGCLSIDAWRNKYTLLGFLAYRWHQTKYFCWSGGAVNSIAVGYYVSDNNGFNYFRGLASQDQWFFRWNGNTRGGHYSMRQATMENCVPFLGCLSVAYPYVRIWVYANGAWTYEVGG